MQKDQTVRPNKYGLHWGKEKTLSVSRWTGSVERLHERELEKPAVTTELVPMP